MKKTLLTSLAFILVIQFGFSQINYTFELDSAEYVLIEEDFTVITGFEEDWGGAEYWENIPIGFTIEFLNREFSHFDLFTEEIIFAYDSLYFAPYHAGISGDIPIFPNPDDDSLYYYSPIIYKTIGEEGSRVFILEYKNAQFWDDPGLEEYPFYTYYTNYQVKMYEGSNVLEVHYGNEHTDSTMFIEDGGPGPVVGIFNFVDNEMLALRGNPRNPEVFTEDNIDTTRMTLDEAPPAGIIYRFTPIPVGINTIDQNRLSLKIAPNPASDYIRLILPESTEAKSMQITNALGQVVYQSNSMQKRIDVTNFLPGMYYMKVTDEKGQIGVASFIKIE